MRNAISIFFISLILITPLIASWSLKRYPAITPLANSQHKDLRVTFFGVSTLLFDDGAHQIMTDGYFSRINLLEFLLLPVSSNQERIAKELSQAQIKHLDALIPLHSHFDHAMDVADVSKLTHATLMGSKSTLNIGRGGGLNEDQMREINVGSHFQIGDFDITIFGDKHSVIGAASGEIVKPLSQPTHAYHYKEGSCFALYIKHRKRSFLVTSSANYISGNFSSISADVVFLAIGGLGWMSADFKQNYWQEIVVKTKAKRVIPLHWDNFFLKTSSLRPLPFFLDDFWGSMDLYSWKAKADNIDLKLPPYRLPFDPFYAM